MVRTSRSLTNVPGTISDHISIIWARSGASVIIWAHLRQFSALAHWIAWIIWDHLESLGIIRAHLGSNGIIQDHLGSSGTIWPHVCSTAMIWNRPESVGSNHLGITQNHLGSSRDHLWITCDHLGSLGPFALISDHLIVWNHLRSSVVLPEVFWSHVGSSGHT